MTREEVILLSAYTGFLLVPDFSEVHKFCEDTLGRPIWTHEFADKDVQKEIQEKLRPRIMELIQNISALRPVSREQMEKVWRGGWIVVRESEITGFNPEFAGHDPIGGYKRSRCKAEAVLDCNDEFVLDNFRPRCGAAMTDGAVQMVTERMEKLYEQTSN